MIGGAGAHANCFNRPLHGPVADMTVVHLIHGYLGVGKTTLLRCLISELEIDAGTIRWGHGMERGYYPQDYGDVIPPNSTPLDWLLQFEPMREHILGRLPVVHLRDTEER